MRKFRSLRYGTIFHLPEAEYAISDGYECRLQKIDHELAVDLRHGLRKKIDGDTEVVVDGFQAVSKEVTDVERVALTLLERSTPDHPCLYIWVRGVVEDPYEFRELDEYCLAEMDSDDIEALPGVGFALPKKYERGEEQLWEKLLDGEGVEDWSLRYGKADSIEKLRVKEGDRAIYNLTHAVTHYRRRGRPDGDWSFTIRGLGVPLVCVHTSLAAAVVEYHQAVVNTFYLEISEIERR